ncbi:hypothetical protein AAFF_G00051470 [Aldrovandia affinis]|uniref:SEA domain-containing protein n=1 Tax=Aldrovandia affinis TaxID=143900 RepID=A0AAD7T5P4_9TELE|nr:hypothetical protein AAFF_G00051470 [Aldrovandia affinis]
MLACVNGFWTEYHTCDWSTTASVKPSSSTSVTAKTTPAPSPTITLTSAVTSHSTASPGTETTTPSQPSPTPGPSATSIVTATTTTIPITPPSPCSPNPCPFNSICVELLNESSTCQCFAGSFFSDGSCRAAKVFAGDLHLLGEKFVPEMKDTMSKPFNETATEILKALKNAMENDTTYITSNVVQLREGSVIAMVDNVFGLTSNTTQESFNTALKSYIETCGDCGPLTNATFTDVSLCKGKPAPCDYDTTTCETKDGIASCICKDGYITSHFSSRICTACPSGQKAEGGICVLCSFGQSGFNCTDRSLLAVVVISCVLGGLLLIMLLVFLIYRLRTPNQKPDQKPDYNSPYPAQEPQANWPNQQVPRIPRASAATGWNPSQLEMTESGSTRALVAKDRPGNGVLATYDVGTDDLRSFKGKNPSRYSYLVQGQDNPYFVADEERGNK